MDKVQFRRMTDGEIEANMETALRNQEQRMLELQRMLDKTKEKLNDPKSKHVREEIVAFERKLEEHQQLKNEFLTAIGECRAKLPTQLSEEDCKTKHEELRKRVSLECRHLGRALPIYAYRQVIVRCVQENQVSVLLAEPGSGKSTQLVQYLLEAGLADHGAIVCTQPRKVGAMSLAMYVAEDLGSDVSCKTEATTETLATSKVVYMTDSALVHECIRDPSLRAISCIVVDEAQERSLFTDLLLAIIKRLLHQRPDLRVVINSTTTDTQKYLDFFQTRASLDISCRSFPVQIIWRGTETKETDFEDYLDAAVRKTLEIHMNEAAGDILVFLSSSSDTQKCCSMFQKEMGDRADFICFPLHEKVQAEEWQRVSQPLDRNKRKIVFATNCAETSITIDGIRYVVDTGVIQEMWYDAERDVQSLKLTVISQSAAEQRKGQAGRTAPGKCYRLYSQGSFQSMETTRAPEILRTRPSHAVLKLAALGIIPGKDDFVQTPSPAAIDAALVSLTRLEALHDNIITDTGRWLARLPFEPNIGLMTLRGHEEGLLYDTVVLATLVSSGGGLFYQGVTPEEVEKFEKSKSEFCQPGGDALTSLEVYKAWERVGEKEKTEWCVSHAVDVQTIQWVRDTVNEVCRTLKTITNTDVTRSFSEAQHNRLRKIMFECNITNLCHSFGLETAVYCTAHVPRGVRLHPSSVIFCLGSYPEWVIYDQQQSTSTDFITGITPVDEEWLQGLNTGRYGFDVEEVRRKGLRKVFTKPVGSYAFFSVIRCRYAKLFQLQENSGVGNSTVVMVDPNRETGEVRVFCTDRDCDVQKLTQPLVEIIETAVQQVKQQVWELKVAEGLRVVLGQGACVASETDVLMPHETRKVYIKRKSKDASEDMIKEKFKRYGEICLTYPYIDNGTWGFLLFRTTAQAAAAVQATEKDKHDAGQLEQHATLRANLTWIRRPAQRAFVTISPEYLQKCLEIGSVVIGEKQVNIEKNLKKDSENSVFLTSLPIDVTEDQIKNSILTGLVQKEDVSDIGLKITIIREKVQKANKKELNRIEKEMENKIQTYLTASKVQVDICEPKKDTDVLFTAKAQFSDRLEGLAVCAKLQTGFCFRRAKVTIEPNISTTLRVSRRVYEACKTEVDEIVEKKIVQMGVKVTERSQGETYHVFTLRADNLNNVAQARALLNDVIKGDVLDWDYANLSSSSGLQMLKEAEEETSTYIRVDNRLKTVSVHGAREACKEVRQKISTYMDMLTTGSMTELLLRGNGRSRGLLKALLSHYGEDLDRLRQEKNLHSIRVDYSRHILTLTGSPDSVERAKEAVEDMDKAGRTESGRSGVPGEDTIDCTICCCPVDRGQLYRLEICAHPFCHDCISQQVNIAIKDHQLPVVCCYEGCSLPWAWSDFLKLSTIAKYSLSALASSALSAFVLKNRDKIRFCPTPDCTMVYRVTNENSATSDSSATNESSASLFFCPECNAYTCTACHENAHADRTCAMVRSEKEEAGSFAAWLREDKINRKACPKCSTFINKDGGCNKMACWACKTIFCWICRQVFKEEKDCYDHLAADHDGIFAVPDQD